MTFGSLGIRRRECHAKLLSIVNKLKILAYFCLFFFCQANFQNNTSNLIKTYYTREMNSNSVSFDYRFLRVATNTIKMAKLTICTTVLTFSPSIPVRPMIKY